MRSERERWLPDADTRATLERTGLRLEAPASTADLLRRPDVDHAALGELSELHSALTARERRIVAETIKYAGYVERQRREADRVARAGSRRIPRRVRVPRTVRSVERAGREAGGCAAGDAGTRVTHRRHDTGGARSSCDSRRARGGEPMNERSASEEQTLAVQIVGRAKTCDVDLDLDRALLLARHMRRVISAESSLHLTSIRTADEFLERHIGESLEGAAMLDRATDGWLLDLGSGNGYPGLPVVACCGALRPMLAEVSVRKAEFLRSVIDELFPGGRVIDRQIQRAEDLADEPAVSVIVTRAMGNWERVLPRLATRISPGGSVLVWAGEQMEAVAGRKAWQRYRLIGRRALPGRERSWVWHFGVA